MITIYVSTSEGLTTVDDFVAGSWVHVSNPSNQELALLVERFGIPLDFLTDPLDLEERARLDTEDGARLVVLRVPHLDTWTDDIPVTTLPIGIVLVDDVVITVSAIEPEVIGDFKRGQVRNFATQERTRFLLQVFMRTTLLFLRYLRDINRASNNVERDLYRSTRNEQLIRLLNLEKCLVFISTSLRANAFMMEKYHNATYSRLDQEDQDLLDEVIIENRQAMEMAKIYSEILSSMMDAFASLISNNLNTVVKTLTTITIILMIPTLVASFYGMNVDLPFQGSPEAFFLIIGFSALLCTIGILIFWRGNLF
ncbi:MAG: magnesium transporter CorA family protein [Methanospirillum sp.]|nr:magnesium transporter CorA family protein [Methanospirillum sp.]